MKKLFVLSVLLLSGAGLVACNQGTPVTKDTTFEFVVRRFNGNDSNYSPKLDGEVLATKTIKVEKGQVLVSEALAKVTENGEGYHKLSFTATDFLYFTETTVGYSTSWFLSDGYMAKETGYNAGDYSYSYMAYNDHYSNGVTADFLDGLTTYTVVVDGWDGNIGTTPSYN